MGRSVAVGREVDALRCGAEPRRTYGIHLEIFVRDHVVRVPGGIGIRPPQRRAGAYVLGGACWYPIHTVEPTGVVEVAAGRSPTLGTFFDVWGQPLARRRLLGFRAQREGSVRVYVAGRAWGSDLRTIPLRPHVQIVLELDGYVPPHRRYRFAPGL